MATVLVASVEGSNRRSSHRPASDRVFVPVAGKERVSAMFGDAGDALEAALLLRRSRPTGYPPASSAVIASGDPSAAEREAAALLPALSPGEIVVTLSAADELRQRLPDAMALQPASLSRGADETHDMDVFRLVPAEGLVAHRLPPAATSFIGRVTQLAELKELVRSRQLVTLSGPPGSGKTRLAVELARRMLGEFPDGAWFVPLAPITDPRLLATTVAGVLGLKEEPTAPAVDLVVRYLESRKLLLILDNFEHVLEGATTLQRWLVAVPRLRVLATSRAALHLSAELEYPVPPLSLPSTADDPRASESEAVALFAERAATVLPGTFDARQLPDVARICRRLDGLPLAVELAAARVRVLPPAAIVERLERSLELLTESARDMPDRHRSLSAAIAWSHDLLNEPERRFLRRLTVFKGGWGLEAARAVTDAANDSEVLELTSSLLDKSLIQRQLDSAEPRYAMLETLREYALERLAEAGEVDPTRRRHALWSIRLAEAAEPYLTGTQQRRWLDRLEHDHDNLRAALRWALDTGDIESGLRLANALWRFWQIRGYIREGREWLAALIDRADGADDRLRAAALASAGSLAYWQQDMQAACRFYEASLELRRGLEPRELAEGLYNFGWALTVPGHAATDQPRGRALGAEALEVFRSIGDSAGEAKAMWLLAWNAHASGDNANALPQLRQSANLFRVLDDPFGLAWALHLLGSAAIRQDRVPEAEASWREALQIFADADDRSGIDAVLDDMATLAVMRGQPARALRLGAAAARLGEASGSQITELVHQMEHRTRTRATRLSEDEARSAWQEGAAMTTADAVAYALGDAEDERPADAHVLRVHALGPMSVERDGVPIRRWGGEKAGSRQAQAIFAFLFDRGERGLTKDEATELIWPDVPIQRADLAFHRTLGGLREVLERDLVGTESINYAGGRYRLNPALVGWSDVEAFEERLNRAAELAGEDALAALEESRRLYRGDLFDDCPFYGESAFVEERRAYLRGRLVDALLALGELYERHAEPVAAAARYRQALLIDPDGRRAGAGLARLGVAS